MNFTTGKKKAIGSTCTGSAALPGHPLYLIRTETWREHSGRRGRNVPFCRPPLAGADERVKRFQMLPFSICGHVPLPHLTTITKKTGQGHL